MPRLANLAHTIHTTARTLEYKHCDENEHNGQRRRQNAQELATAHRLLEYLCAERRCMSATSLQEDQVLTHAVPSTPAWSPNPRESAAECISHISIDLCIEMVETFGQRIPRAGARVRVKAHGRISKCVCAGAAAFDAEPAYWGGGIRCRPAAPKRH